jgi:tripartite-type tricarboxylate transporter receptor subunit TctC
MWKYLVLIAAGLLLAGPPARSQENVPPALYPSRSIRIIVCLPAGGGVDTVTRIVADGLQRRLGQPVMVENKGGQAGNLGAEAVWAAEPDGYTLLASPPAPLTTNALLYRSVPFDPARFTPVAVMTTVPNTLTVRADFPAQDLSAFVAHARAHPGQVRYASQSSGTTSHLTAVLFELASGVRLLHVPYRGTAPAINDLMGGHVDAFFNELATSMEMQKAGRVRILAVTTLMRIPELPDVPTMQEAGLTGFVSDTWNAISAPPKTPAPIVATLNAAINEVLGTPEVQSRLRLLHLAAVGGSPQRMADIVKADAERWSAVIRAAKVTLE